MQKNPFFQRLKTGFLKKLIIMKLMTFFLFIALLQVRAGGYSQNITISLKNTSIESVFKEIQKQSDYHFFYNEKLIKNAQKITINVKDVPVQTVLQICFKDQPFSYAVDNKQIIIKVKETAKINVPELRIPIMPPIDITGKIMDADGNPLPGATIKLKGSQKMVVADANGQFSLQSSAGSGVLIISFVGHETREVAFSSEGPVTVILMRKETKADEVVVIGYGTQRKADLTGAVSTIKGDDLTKSSSPNVSNAIAGRGSGVIATSNSGNPGDDNSTILIRGINSFGGGTAPLIVVDGIADRDFNRLNPADIESITVLKDASAAIYGVRSANGVILVTTRRGGSGKNKVDYDFSYGLQQYTRIRPVITSSLDFMLYQNEASVNEGNAPLFTQELITKYNLPKTTDWFKATFRNLAPQQQHRLSFSGGNDKVNYYVSGQYLEQKSNYKVSDKVYKQFNLVSNIDAKVSKNIKLSLDLNARRMQNDNPVVNPYVAMLHASVMPPWIPEKWDNGQYATYGLNVNSVAETSNLPGYNNVVTYLLNSKLGVNILLPFVTQGLSVSSYYAYDASQSNSSTWTKPYAVFTFNDNVYNDLTGTTGIVSLNKDNSLNIRKTFLTKLSYVNKFGNHNVNAFAAYEESSFDGDQIRAYRQGFLGTNLPQLFAGGTANMLGTGAGAQDGRASYFGRLGYDYNGKYLAEFSLRYNGSFNFAPSKRWGTFPAVSLGWRISQEAFFKNNINIIENLKLRASWALMGSDAIAPYQYFQRYIVTPSDWYNNFLYTGTGSSSGYTQNPQIYNGAFPNPNITWEKQDSKNIGLDIALLSNRITASVDFFKYNRRDILTRPNASVPIYTGLNLPDANIGESENKGVDFSINYSEKRSVVKYYAGINFTYTKNRIIFKDESPLIPDYQKATHFASDAYMIYETNGIYRNKPDVDKSAHLDGAAPGDIWIKDKNGDGKIDGADMVRIPYSPTPKLVVGVPMGIEWKGITVDLIWVGQTKAKILYQPMSGLSDANPPKWLADGRWTINNSDAPYPRAFTGKSNRNQLPTDFFLIDGSFIRLKSAEIGYNLPAHLFEKMKVANIRVSLSGFNLFSIDHFKKYGRDVENTSIPGSYGAGNNSAFNYPQTRIYQIGLRVSF